MNDTLTKEIAQLIAGVGTVLLPLMFKKVRAWLMYKMEKVIRCHRPDPGGEVAYYELIHDELIKTMLEANAERCYLMQFHNGEVFSSEKPMFKITCTDEVVKPGTSYDRTEIRGLVASHLLEEILPLYGTIKQGVHRVNLNTERCGEAVCIARGVYTINSEQMPESPARAMMLKRGAVYSVITPLLKGNRVIGYIGLDYTATDTVQPDFCILCQASTKVSVLLAN